MFLLNSEATKITPADLQGLCDNQVIESRDIEYKQTVAIGPKADEKKKIKLVAGISSFANTDGGDFVVGIKAVNGIPQTLTPIERGQLDSIKLAIEQLVQTGVNPRITPLLHEIRLSDTHSVLVVRVGKSWAAPHRVTLAGDNNFYGRHSSGMYPMDVDQIRAAFNLTGAIHERIEKTRERLLNVILSRDSKKLFDPPWIVLHMIPFESLDPSRVFDLRSQGTPPSTVNLTPLGEMMGQQRYLDVRFNFDGLISCCPETHGEAAARLFSYTQLFRNGLIESVNANIGTRSGSMSGGNATAKTIPARDVAAQLLMAFRRFLRVQERLQVAPPILVLVSLLGVGDHILDISRGTSAGRPLQVYRFDRDRLSIAGVVVDSFKVDRACVFRSILDVLWNAAGLDRCKHYTDDGKLTLELECFQGEITG